MSRRLCHPVPRPPPAAPAPVPPRSRALPGSLRAALPGRWQDRAAPSPAHLRLREVQHLGQPPLLAGADVALLLEAPLQLLQLRGRELGAGPARGAAPARLLPRGTWHERNAGSEAGAGVQGRPGAPHVLAAPPPPLTRRRWARRGAPRQARAVPGGPGRGPAAALREPLHREGPLVHAAGGGHWAAPRRGQTFKASPAPGSEGAAGHQMRTRTKGPGARRFNLPFQVIVTSEQCGGWRAWGCRPWRQVHLCSAGS